VHVLIKVHSFTIYLLFAEKASFQSVQNARCFCGAKCRHNSIKNDYYGGKPGLSPPPQILTLTLTLNPKPKDVNKPSPNPTDHTKATCKMRTCGRADPQRVKRGPKSADHMCGRVASQDTLITCVVDRLKYWKTNFIGDHGMWVNCGPGPQLWSAFYPWTVRRSAFYQWPHTNPNRLTTNHSLPPQ